MMMIMMGMMTAVRIRGRGGRKPWWCWSVVIASMRLVLLGGWRHVRRRTGSRHVLSVDQKSLRLMARGNKVGGRL